LTPDGARIATVVPIGRNVCRKRRRTRGREWAARTASPQPVSTQTRPDNPFDISESTEVVAISAFRGDEDNRVISTDGNR